MQTQTILVIFVVMSLVLLVFLLILLSVVRLKTQALRAGVRVGIADILGMKLRKTPPHLIVHAAIELRQRGVPASVRDIEGYYLASAASGDRTSTAAELADIVEAVKRSKPGSPPLEATRSAK